MIRRFRRRCCNCSRYFYIRADMDALFPEWQLIDRNSGLSLASGSVSDLLLNDVGPTACLDCTKERLRAQREHDRALDEAAYAATGVWPKGRPRWRCYLCGWPIRWGEGFNEFQEWHRQLCGDCGRRDTRERRRRDIEAGRICAVCGDVGSVQLWGDVLRCAKCVAAADPACQFD